MFRKSLAIGISLFAVVQAHSVVAQISPGWNRRLTGISLVEGGGNAYDVVARWRLDLTGDSSTPVELGTNVELQVNTVPVSSMDAPNSLTWDIAEGVLCSTEPDDTACGQVTISENTVGLACNAGKCSTPELTASIPSVSLNPNDELLVSLQPTTVAMPDISTADDDSGGLVFGSWNRRVVSLSVSPSPGAPAGLYDVTAEVLVELTHSATVPLDLSMDTEPVADECCLEACCCPPCSSECGGNGCGHSGTQDINIGVGELVLPTCPSPGCNGGCGDGIAFSAPFQLSCDPSDCTCRSETLTLTWTELPFQPGDQVVLVLRPAPGALPELPGGGDDMGSVEIPGPVPTSSSWGLGIMVLLILSAASVVISRTRRRAI